MKLLSTTIGVAAITLLAAVPARAGGATSTTSAVDLYPTSSTSTLTQVDGAWSTLVRNDSGASATFHTTELQPGNAVTLWAVVFNNPSACNSGHFGLRCGPGDLGRQETEASIVYVAGHLIGGDGVGDFGGHLTLGDTSGALFGPGLINPTGADIHLLVRDNGTADPSLMPDQIHSFGTCNTVCQFVQVSAHEAAH